MVTVVVMDVNEHNPQCDMMPFTFTTDEANLNQVFLGRVTATDRDGVEVGSGQLVYQLASSSDRISVNAAVSCDSLSINRYQITYCLSLTG